MLFTYTCSLAQGTVILKGTAQEEPTIDGFGTCLYGSEGLQPWFQDLYYNNAEFSILRMDLVPQFTTPYSDNLYNCPWFHNNPPLPGPDGNNARAYTNATDYTALFGGNRAQIAVMGPDIEQNILKFNYASVYAREAGTMAQLGEAQKQRLGDFKLTGSIWSPAPWLKIPSGNSYRAGEAPLPIKDVKYPYIWAGNFVGG